MKKMWMMILAMSGAAALSVHAADANETWSRDCAKCHGANGDGQTKMGQKMGVKNFTDAKVQEAMTDEKMFKAIKEGLKVEGHTKMKAYGETLSDDEIKALVKHVRGLKK